MNQYQLDFYAITLLGAAVLSAGIAIYAWIHRRADSAAALCLMAISIGIWTFGHAFEMAGTTYPIKMFWAKINNIGIVAAPVTWLIFAMRHTLRGKHIPRWLMAALTVIPLITLGLVFTNEAHHLFWSDVKLVEVSGLLAFSYTFGPWFWWVHSIYSYLLIFVGAGLIIRFLARREGIYRGQAIALLVAVVTPWVSNAIFLLGISPVPHLDLTPFAFTITLISLTWAIFGYQLTNISPLARDLLVDSMNDGVIVLDGRGRVADINLAAGRMIGVLTTQALGKPLDDLFAPWPHVTERFGKGGEASEEITVGEGAARRRYEIRIAPLQDTQRQQLGHIITMRDTTGGNVPPPRFASREMATPAAPEREPLPAPPTTRAIPVVGPLLDFLRTPLKTDLPVPPNTNPKWFQARERAFTLILRIAALVGTMAWLIAPSFANFTVGLPFAIIIVVMWFLGLARSINFDLRAGLLILMVYLLALTETYSFGYSVESFVFFMALTVLGVLLLGRMGGVAAFGLSVLTLGLFGVQIGRGAFVPPSAYGDIIIPDTVQRAITALITFSASGAALLSATTILMESLNKAWHMETQALNLLQQERDMLELRVQERTRDLAEARDEALRSRDELRKYFLAIEQSGNTIVITDPEGHIEYANPKFEELTGYRLAEVRGQTSRFLQSGDHGRDYYQKLWETIRSGQIWHGEFHNRRKDGSLFWESATIAPVLNDQAKITHYVAVKEDVTSQKELQKQLRLQNDQMAREIAERVRAETRLQDSEARFRQIVENASDIIYRTDATGHFTYLNPTGLRVAGYQVNELMGRRFLEIITPAYRHRAERFFARQVLGKIPNTYSEFPILTGDGQEIWLGQNVQAILENGQVVEMQAVARDVTERKRFEDALALARDQALEASQVKSQLLSKVNHELRTPLGAILGFAELLRSGSFGALAPSQEQAMGQIVDSVNYLTGIVNELLDAAQIEARKLRLNIEICNPRALLKQIEASMAILAQNKGLKFSVQVSPEVPPNIMGDERRLKQILINLVGNAIKFTQAGEVRINVFCPDATHWALQVSDTGMGIPPEAQGYIFEPFRQVHNTSTREYRGTGLGLSITRQLVELMDGEITLASEVGRGSTFTIKLPIHLNQQLGTRPLPPLPKEDI